MKKQLRIMFAFFLIFQITPFFINTNRQVTTNNVENNVYNIGVNDVYSLNIQNGELFGTQVLSIDYDLNVIRIETSNIDAFIQKAGKDIRYAEIVKSIHQQYTPNDPYYSSQYAPQRVNLPQAWSTTRGDLDAKICIVDSGIVGHLDFEMAPGESRIYGSINYVSGESGIDYHGHGTHVAGIAAAQINNARGIAGAGNIKIYVAKVFDASGYASDSHIASGIKWCADRGSRTVINMSFGSISPSSLIADALFYASNKGALLVAASGNHDFVNNYESVLFPAKHSLVVAVEATNSGNQVTSYSNYGPELELAAPGDNIISTWNNGGYNYLSGTSMASPLVAGIAALIWSYKTSLTAGELRNILRSTAYDLGSAGRDNYYGHGLIDAYAALQYAIGYTPPCKIDCEPSPPPRPDPRL